MEKQDNDPVAPKLITAGAGLFFLYRAFEYFNEYRQTASVEWCPKKSSSCITYTDSDAILFIAAIVTGGITFIAIGLVQKQPYRIIIAITGLLCAFSMILYLRFFV